MQLRMPFDGSEAAGTCSPQTGSSRPALGILTRRPWRQVELPEAVVVDRLRRELPLDIPVSDRLLTILASRGHVDAPDLERFFYPSLNQLTDPFLLKEMDRAVARILTAVRSEEKVAVHGDFDVDGITGCALVTELLRSLSLGGRQVDVQPPFVPDRSRDGYGVAGRMIRHWGETGVTLLVTVDTGATAHTEIAQAGAAGLDVVVLDHHLFSQRPPAVALVSPQRPDADYPHTDLCGVAVAFKVVQALRQAEPGCLPEAFEASVLDLVALGLVADQMPLVGENRVLVRKGLAHIADRRELRPGLVALLTICGLDHGFPVTASDLAYQVAPRLNACGRIGRVATALELLLTDDRDQAHALAREADETNQRRRQEDQVLQEEAVGLALPYIEGGDQGLVLASPAWHKGIIGIGAARLVDLYQVPTVLFAVEGEEARGSARSVPHVNIKATLDDCAAFLMRYGGHAQAAGMTLRAQDIPSFRDAFLAALAKSDTTGPFPVSFDLDLPLGAMTAAEVADHMIELEQLEPFGSGNRKPVYRCCNLCLLRPPTSLSNKAHLRFAFRTPASPSVASSPALGREFISFGSGAAWQRLLDAYPGDEKELLRRRWDILFQISRSSFRPQSRAYDPVQQQLMDIKPAGES